MSETKLNTLSATYCFFRNTMYTAFNHQSWVQKKNIQFVPWAEHSKFVEFLCGYCCRAKVDTAITYVSSVSSVSSVSK